MRGHVSEDQKRERSSRLIALAEQMEADFAKRFIGRSLDVLWENVAGVTPDGFINVGYTDNYIRVRCIHPRVLTDHITSVCLRDFENGQMHVSPVLADEEIIEQGV